MGEVHLVWLIDSDPPSEIGGGRGFYPASSNTEPPDEALMRSRLATILDVASGEAGGGAVVTLHTSPRYRSDFLEEPYPQIWRDCRVAGLELALHPHEERADGTTFYDNGGHLRRVIAATKQKAAVAGITFTAFRSGSFSFHPALPALLAEAGIAIDLSAGPGLVDPKRGIAWPESSAEPDCFATDGILEVPLGWDGAGNDLSRNYLFNERMDLAGLVRVFDAIMRRSEAIRKPILVNFLAHGFGLAERGWREQAIAFLRHAEAGGACLLSAAEAFRRHPVAAEAAPPLSV